MKHLGLILALLAMSTNVMAAARTSTAMASSASRKAVSASPAGSMTLSKMVRHDGRTVTDSYAERFVKRGAMVSWEGCRSDLKRAGLCSFYLVEEKSDGDIQALMMTEEQCSSRRAFCRNGYVASLRTRTESSYNAGDDTISVTTKLWRTFKSVRGTYFERYAGKVEGTLGRHSYDFTSYDNRGNELDRVGATIMASGGLSIDLCTMAWEASLSSSGIIGGGVGSMAAVAMGDLLLGAAALMEGSILGGFAGGTLAVGVAVAEAPVLVGIAVGVTTAVAVVGVSALAINHWCEPDAPDGPDEPEGPDTPETPEWETPDGEGCGEGEVWGPYEYDCGYETVEEGVSEDGYLEITVTWNDRTCIAWDCIADGL